MSADTKSGVGRNQKVPLEEVLEVFGQSDDPVLGTKDVARELDVSRVTASGYLEDLEEQGLVEKSEIGQVAAWYLPGDENRRLTEFTEDDDVERVLPDHLTKRLGEEEDDDTSVWTIRDELQLWTKRFLRTSGVLAFVFVFLFSLSDMMINNAPGVLAWSLPGADLTAGGVLVFTTAIVATAFFFTFFTFAIFAPFAMIDFLGKRLVRVEEWAQRRLDDLLGQNESS
jgi:DNA-binding transcriptional ArsR family regulator